MRISAKKAALLSVTGHALLLLAIFLAGFSQPIPRGYPRVLTATFVERSSAVNMVHPAAAPRAVINPRPEPPVTKEVPGKIAVPQKTPPRKPATKPEATPKPRSPAKAPTISQAPPTSGGSAPAGSGGREGPVTSGIAKVDVPDFAFPHYLVLLQLRIENQWRPPYAGSGQFLATVHFVIAKSGRLISHELEKSSGNFAFDQAALRAVQNASPLPPLPEDSGLEILGVHFDFVANW
ncbi:MAG: TonB family protein [candidate division KSB1 bacterium]|nr:TonB family protein [candidate division KSB1 bacterium]MDZ7275272.1 TonB family protein [candidate division KSB1 bacterium]MDZ7287440.1 TonB family protein [candidate division KSB1 bacterium]MDZ7299554.1 TonB family protein [candidate division KSB1 bacterium]MDZ7308012.1 TonB family protein [candidate division KSB1 bacterium]